MSGERRLQQQFDSEAKALAFYDKQMLDYLNDAMQSFIKRIGMVFLATADGEGQTDCSIKTGAPGFIKIVDKQTLLFPEYKGNGVMASLGNLVENPHLTLLFIDFFQHQVGLHVNGSAVILSEADAYHLHPELPNHQSITTWVKITVEEAYIHCSKNIPLLQHVSQPSGTKSGDFFHVARDHKE
ncbi:pyridoxamine 5'-phosphate oxidase family protein [Tuberibacillus sp. Marseille-P3662]|uniref:pyridoxamine 5'-phosphate oxidase family protein n=1 Tax=Tuberibacillus sp. Marseille-P3662 TaxID=1965358 RepID=UPI0020CB3EAD|nr:pyridoxamine 5'-phosphate oxidase family protein [Tuberibacillus sp. Marseille-P3662]